MQEELPLIMALMDEPLNINTLKKIKNMALQNVDPKYVENIQETKYINRSAQFLISSKTILVNYKKLNEFTEKAAQTLKEDTFTKKEKDIKMIKLLTAYRILLHEIHHSKQTYNVFDICGKDLETEIIRTIYNIDWEEYIEDLKNRDKIEIIEEKTGMLNRTLIPYSDINPIERKAEIESYKRILEIIKPIQELFPNIYNEIEIQRLYNMYNGYDFNSPFEQLLNIIKSENKKLGLPYDKDIKDLNDIQSKATEIEKMELGLKVSENTIEQTRRKIEKILYIY